jgi:cyclophilin family peptidyl-prolyl cis-trans isomerase
LKAKKARTFRNRMIVLAGIVVLVAAAALVYFFGGSGVSGSPPAYASASNSLPYKGTQCTFSVLWNDDVNVSGYVFGSNVTGTFVNDTWIPFSKFANSTAAIASAAKTLNNSIGDTIVWRVWCNDSNNRWSSIAPQNVAIDSNKILLMTDMGNITIELFDDVSIATANFKNLTRLGIYDHTLFHRVVPGFVIQGGDPLTAGRTITIPKIRDELPNRHSNVRGSVAMAKTDEPNSATSQFYINLNDTNAAKLDVDYTVFGRVTAGMDVVDAIGSVPTDSQERPTEEIRLIKAELVG